MTERNLLRDLSTGNVFLNILADFTCKFPRIQPVRILKVRIGNKNAPTLRP